MADGENMEHSREERRRDRSADRRRDRSPARNHRDDRGGRDDREERRRGERRHDDRGDRRDRDRDHKRRKSPSPTYRDRRNTTRSPPAKRPALESRDRARAYGADERGAPPPAPDLPRRNSGFDVLPPHMSGFGGADIRRDGGGMLSYKQFMLELEDDVSPSEAERRYEAYKTEYVNTQKLTFFNQHKDEDWLRDKYDPMRLEAFLTRRNEAAQNAAKEFMDALQSGRLDKGPAATGNRERGGEEDGDGEGGARRRRAGDRRGRERDEEFAPKVPASAAEPKRVAEDVKQAKALMTKLDVEKNITANILIAAGAGGEGQESDVGAVENGDASLVIQVEGRDKALTGLELLDVLLAYLWRVHGLDYYGAVELKGFPRGLRTVRGEEGSDKADGNTAKEGWNKKVDDTWQARLGEGGMDPLVALLGRDQLEKSATDAIEKLVRKIRDEKYGWKYGCGVKGCTKLFHGPEYVVKHLRLKHTEVVEDAAKVTKEEIYKSNYLSDPEAPIPGVAAAPAPARPMPRRELGGRRRPDFGPPPLDRGPLPPYPGRGAPRDIDRFERGGRDVGRFERGMPGPEMADRLGERYPPGPPDGDRFDREPADRERLERPPPLERVPTLDRVSAGERLPVDVPPFDREPYERERGRDRELDRERDRFERGDRERFDRGARDADMYDRRPVDGERFEREPMDEDRFDRPMIDGERYSRPPRDLDPFDPDSGRDMYPPPLLGRPPYDDRAPFDGPPLEPPLFEPFDGPPIRAPFGPGVPEPPPMLIPVPGAGPLGPFVPAPPEVAMRMMRERGGPGPPPFFDGFDAPYDAPPFEDDGPDGVPPIDARGGPPRGRLGPRGRGSRDGPPPGSRGMGPMSGPPPMMVPIPPGIRPDPRRVRSYKDLDAPEDEVTVIDYRSL